MPTHCRVKARRREGGGADRKSAPWWLTCLPITHVDRYMELAAVVRQVIVVHAQIEPAARRSANDSPITNIYGSRVSDPGDQPTRGRCRDRSILGAATALRAGWARRVIATLAQPHGTVRIEGQSIARPHVDSRVGPGLGRADDDRVTGGRSGAVAPETIELVAGQDVVVVPVERAERAIAADPLGSLNHSVSVAVHGSDAIRFGRVRAGCPIA